MNDNGTSDTQPRAQIRSTLRSPTGHDDELERAKRELLQSEVRLARTRTTIVSAEIDIKALTAQRRALAKCETVSEMSINVPSFRRRTVS